MSFFDHFAQSSSTPIGDWIVRRTKQREFGLLRPFLPRRSCAILEIGPGTGELTELFRQAGYSNYTAVEPNNKMRNRLESRGVKTKDYQIPHLDEEDNSYDVIVLCNVFEHLDGYPEASIFIDEARRALRPGGLLCIVAPDYLHWKEDFFNCDFSHNNVTTVRRTLQMLHNNCFMALGFTYLSGFFSGPLATVVSNLVRCGMYFSKGNGFDPKLYKLKTTFLRSFLIIGENESPSVGFENQSTLIGCK